MLLLLHTVFPGCSPPPNHDVSNPLLGRGRQDHQGFSWIGRAVDRASHWPWKNCLFPSVKGGNARYGFCEQKTYYFTAALTSRSEYPPVLFNDIG